MLSLDDAMRGKKSCAGLLTCCAPTASATPGPYQPVQTIPAAGDVESSGGAAVAGVSEDVVSAARASNAHDFISAFSAGYATDVGEGSIMVSGGQKQRIGKPHTCTRLETCDYHCIFLFNCET